MTRIVVIAAFLGILLAMIGAPRPAVSSAAAAQASNYCGGVSDSLRASGWVPAGCR